jgi:hypothetical protein
MRKAVRTDVARSVATHLISTEVAMDETLVKMMALVGVIVEGRLKANLPMACANDAVHAINRCATLMSEARTGLIDAHGMLAAAKNEVGLREVSFGDMMGCPGEILPTTSAVIPLRRQL